LERGLYERFLKDMRGRSGAEIVDEVRAKWASGGDGASPSGDGAAAGPWG